MTRPYVDVYVGADGLETVRCSPSRLDGHGGVLQLDGVTFRSVSDDTLQQIADAIELYLIRKNQRQRRAKTTNAPAAAPAAAPEGTPDAKV